MCIFVCACVCMRVFVCVRVCSVLSCECVPFYQSHALLHQGYLTRVSSWAHNSPASTHPFRSPPSTHPEFLPSFAHTQASLLRELLRDNSKKMRSCNTQLLAELITSLARTFPFCTPSSQTTLLPLPMKFPPTSTPILASHPTASSMGTSPFISAVSAAPQLLQPLRFIPKVPATPQLDPSSNLSCPDKDR